MELMWFLFSFTFQKKVYSGSFYYSYLISLAVILFFFVVNTKSNSLQRILCYLNHMNAYFLVSLEKYFSQEILLWTLKIESVDL